MEDQRKKTGADAAGGTLKDEAASRGEEVSFGSLMMKDFGGQGKEESESRRAEAISSNYILSGSQVKNEVSEILRRREGDSEVLMDEEGAGRTVFQKRILESAREARGRYFDARDAGDVAGMAKYGAKLVKLVDALTKEGLSEAPEVLELIHEEDVEELSVVFDAGVAKGVLRNIEGIQVAEEPEAERDIGLELSREFEGEAEEAPDAPHTDAEVGNVAGANYSDAPENPGAADTEDSLEEDAQIDEAEMERDMRGYVGQLPPPFQERKAGSAAGKPEPVAEEATKARRERLAWEDTHELEKISAGALKLTPLGDEERGRIGKLDELSSGELGEMAEKRREQAGLILSKDKPRRAEMGKWYVEFMRKMQDAGLDSEDSLAAMRVAKMELLKQADELDALAAKRYAVPGAQEAGKAEPIQPKRPEPIRRRSTSPKPAAPLEGEIDSWAAEIGEGGQEGAFFQSGDSGTFKMFERPDGTINVDALYGTGQAGSGKAAHVMGLSGEPGRRRDKTALGMPAAVSAEGEEASPEAKKNEAATSEEGKAGTVTFDTQFLAQGAAGKEKGPAGLGVMGAKEGGAQELTRTQMFGQFDRDPEMAQIASEGSGALSLEHMKEISGAKPAPLPEPDLQRLATGQLPAVSAAVNRIAGLGDTDMGMRAAHAEEAPEVPPYGMDADAEAEEAEADSEKEVAEGVPFDPAQTSMVGHEALEGENGGPKVWGEVAFGDTRLSCVESALLGAAEAQKPVARTMNERPKENFSIYGDIYYLIEKVHMETTGITAEMNSMNNFAAMLPGAIRKAEMLANAAKGGELEEGEKLKKGETQIIKTEEARVARLRIFQEDFLEIPKGKEEPKKSLLAYNEWLANKKQEYAAISNVHELLGKAQAGELWKEGKYGVSPGEYNRIGMLRLCNAAIKSGNLGEQEEAKVEKLREMLEPVARGEKDIFAQTIAADATYEMIVGFATKQERARARQLEQELGKYKIAVAEYEEKRDIMVKVLAEVLVSVRGTEKDAARMKEKIKQAIMALEPTDALERIKYMKLIRDAQAGEGGEAGKELRSRADKLSAETVDIPSEEAAEAVAEAKRVAQAKPIGVIPSGKSPDQRALEDMRAAFYGETNPRRIPQAQAVPAQKVPKQHGPVSRSIGTAITMAAGAALLAGGLWLSQNGIITLGTRADATTEKPIAAQVENVVEETAEELSAGVIEADAGRAPAKKMVFPAAPKPDAGVSADAGSMAEATGGESAEPEGQQSEKYPRDSAGLKIALDDWCQHEVGLLVDKQMLRAAYASIEGKLGGEILPHDKEWVPLMLGMKFPNRVIELSVMSDLARSQLDPEEMYAALMRLSIVLGERAGNPKSLSTTINEANAKGIVLPPLGKASHLGKIEGAKVGERCLFAAYHESVNVRMAQIKKEALESGTSKEEFKAMVSGVLGANAKRILELYESSSYEANFQERRDSCRTLTGGKRGTAALERALGFVIPKWAASHERAKAKAEQYQKGVDDVLGAAPKVKTNAPKHEGKKESKTSPCAGKEGMKYLSCVNELNQKKLEEASKIGGEKKGKQKAAKSPCEDLKGSFYYFQCLEEKGVKDNGGKKMPKPTGKEAGTTSKAPRMFARY